MPRIHSRPWRLAVFSTALLSSGLVGTAAVAQAPPATDVHLIPLESGENGEVSLGTPRNLTDRDGYDNQPAFLPDGSAVLYASIAGEGDAAQADILRYDLEGGTVAKVTDTPESEYSPTPIPGDEGAISVVRVEADGTQRLWRFPLAGNGAPRLLLPDLAPVGYHAWLDPRRVALFVLGEPPTLQVAAVGPGGGRTLASDIGRGLASRPGTSELAFIHKRGDEDWRIALVDASAEEPEPRVLIATRPGSEDFAWATNGGGGSLWMAEGSTLYRWRPGGEGWTRVADLAEHGLGALSRLAFDPRGRFLAVVAERSVPEPREGAKAGNDQERP